MILKNLVPRVVATASPEEQLKQAQALARHLELNNPDFSAMAQRSWLATAKAAFITNDLAMERMLSQASTLAKISRPVLIIGPSGTGKEVVAQLLHTGRKRPSGEPAAFQALNCAGIPGELLESILFGHEQGAFTGAHRDKRGLIELAGDGTFFFDEIGELRGDHQAKILRVLQERKVRPVGASEEVEVKCRFIFANRRSLRDMVSAGTFREDLYYRIAQATLYTTALAERPGDVPLIAAAICRRENWNVPIYFPPEVINSAGNVRALEAYIFRTEVLSMPPEDAVRDL